MFFGVVLVNISEGIHAASVLGADAVPMTDMLLYGALPALVAAFSYPIGNQLVWQVSYNAKNKNTELAATAQASHQIAENELPPLSAIDSHYPADTDSNTHTTESVSAELPPSLLQNLIAKIPAIQTTLLQDAFNKVWLMTLGSVPFWLVLGIVVHPELPDTKQVFNTLLVALLAGVAATSIFLYAREKAETSSEVAGVDATQASEVIFALIGGMLLLNSSLPSMMGLIGIALIIIGLILFAKDG